MATTKAKRSVHPTQPGKDARRNDRRTAARHSDQASGPSQRRNPIRSSSPPSGSLASERTLPGGRSVELPQVNGKTTDKIELFTTAEYHCITIHFQDQTSLNLRIRPGFTINAELHQHKNEEALTLAERPPFSAER